MPFKAWFRALCYFSGMVLVLLSGGKLHACAAPSSFCSLLLNPQTPAFIFCATKAAIKGLSAETVRTAIRTEQIGTLLKAAALVTLFMQRKKYCCVGATPTIAAAVFSRRTTNSRRILAFFQGRSLPSACVALVLVRFWGTFLSCRAVVRPVRPSSGPSHSATRQTCGRRSVCVLRVYDAFLLMFVGVSLVLPGTADERMRKPDHLEQHLPSPRAARRRSDRKGEQMRYACLCHK